MRAELKIFERVEQYLLGDLDSADRLSFENELATNPDLVAQLEFQRNLVLGLENVALKSSTQAAYRKFKVKSLVNKIFLSTVVVAVGVASTFAVMNFGGEEEGTDSIETSNVIVAQADPGDGDEMTLPAEADTFYMEEGDVEQLDDHSEIFKNAVPVDDQIAALIENDQDGNLSDDEIDEIIVDNSNNNADNNGYFTKFEEVESGKSWLGAPPKIFSPDGDGVEDKWCLPVKNLKTFHLVITENNGKLRKTVFETKNSDDHWDGTHAGLMMPDGKYSFVLEALGEDGVEHNRTGKINLKRSSSFNSKSKVDGLWVMFNQAKKNKDPKWVRIQTNDLTALMERPDIKEWFLVVPTENMKKFQFKIYDKKSKTKDDLIYMTYDPNFAWKFKEGELFHKGGKYYYTIDGIGLDGKKWLQEDVLLWEPSKKRKNNSSEKLLRAGSYGDKKQDWKTHELNVNLASCNVPNSAVIDVPKLLTPNGDGKDDFWTIQFQNIHTLDVKIYDDLDKTKRRLVYQTEKIGFKWDGRTEKILNPPGAYYYEALAIGFDGLEHSITGSIDMRYVRGKGM